MGWEVWELASAENRGLDVSNCTTSPALISGFAPQSDHAPVPA